MADVGGRRRRSKLFGSGSSGLGYVLIALTSTVVLFVVVGVAVVNSTGWPAVKQSFFNGYYFRTSFTEVLDAFWLNVKIFSVAEVAILIVALGIAVHPRAAGAGVLPAAGAGRDLHRPVSRDPDDPCDLHPRVWSAGAPALRGPEQRACSGARSR